MTKEEERKTNGVVLERYIVCTSVDLGRADGWILGLDLTETEVAGCAKRDGGDSRVGAEIYTHTRDSRVSTSLIRVIQMNSRRTGQLVCMCSDAERKP
jgi:hypothetical protein